MSTIRLPGGLGLALITALAAAASAGPAEGMPRCDDPNCDACRKADAADSANMAKHSEELKQLEANSLTARLAVDRAILRQLNHVLRVNKTRLAELEHGDEPVSKVDIDVVHKTIEHASSLRELFTLRVLQDSARLEPRQTGDQATGLTEGLARA